MALFSFGNRGSQPNKLGSIQVQTSEIGVAVPYAAGTVKMPIKLLDYIDFAAVKQSQGGKGGGNYNYEYYAAVDCALCTGPAAGIGNIFDGGGSSSLLASVETYTIPSGGGTYRTQYNTNQFYFDEGVTRPVNYSVNADDYGSDGTIVISGTQQAPMQKVATVTGSGQYSVDATGHYTFSAADAGTPVTITYTYTTADVSQTTNRSPAQQYALALTTGVWGYMATAHPERAVSYPGVVRVTSQSMDLGTTASTPNLSIELLNIRNLSLGGGVSDCDPAAVIRDVLTDPVVGCNWPWLGDTTQYSDFCVANRIVISPLIDSQRKATDLLKELLDLTSAECIWSGNTLKLVPYGDSTAVGFGRTFVPQNTPVYVIDESEFLCGDGEDGLTTAWADLADNYNRVEMEYTRRDDSYNTDVIREQDEASILMNGLLPKKTITAHHFCTTDAASVALNIALKRKCVPLRTYAGKLPWYYQLLEPMDIVVLDLETGNLGPTPVRITSVAEEDDYSISIEAEDFVFGTGTGVLYPKQGVDGNGPAAHDDPGDTSLLAAFQAPTRITTNGGNELWLALSGGPSWGGCGVWLSKDGATYSQIGTQSGSSRAGTLTAPLAVGADPDTTDTASVNVAGTLTTVSQSDADSFATISLIGQELVSYETVNLVSSSGQTNNYNLTYLRRGVFSSGSVAHGAGEIFVRLDSQVFKYALDPTLLGTTIYLKLTSQNLYGQSEQALADVSAIPVVLGIPNNSTMRVGSYLNSDGTDATVTVYLPGSSGNGSATLSNGAVVSLPPQTFSPQALKTTYYVNYNPSSSAYVLYTSANACLADQQAGMIGIGSTTTPAGGSGSSASTSGSYSDTGSSPTQNPAGAYTSNPAVVSASAQRTGSQNDQTTSSTSGMCAWFGFAGTTSSARTLSLTAAFAADQDGDGTGGSCYGSIIYTLDGSTYTNLKSFAISTAAQTLTVSVPAGTNLSNVRVEATCHATATTANSESDASLSISNLSIM